MKNRIDILRQKTPWEDKYSHTVSQKFISEIYHKNYKNKHPKLSDKKEANK